MNKSMYVKISMCCLVAAVLGRYAYTQSQRQDLSGPAEPDVSRYAYTQSQRQDLPGPAEPDVSRYDYTQSQPQDLPGVAGPDVSWCTYTQAQPENLSETMGPDVGRRDPFKQVTPEKGRLSLIKKVFSSDRPADKAPELLVETVMLKFLDAKNLKTALVNMTTDYGTITADTKSNSLIVCDNKANLQKILAEIKKADKMPQQIMVEVVILDVKLEDDTEIGVNWDMLSDRSLDISYRQGFTSRLSTSNYTTAVGPAGNLSIIFGSVREVIHLLQQKKDVEILASPRVMMVSGQSAYIEAVEEIPYEESSQTSEGEALITYTEFKIVGVKLTVSATLTDDDDILLTVDAEQSVQTGESNKGVPIVDTRKVKTSLLLRDGQIVIIAGLRRQEKTKEVDQIPLLGDLPIVGELFKSTKDIVNNSELVVFISPHIYKGEPPGEQEMSKFNEISNRPLLELPDEPTTGDYIKGIIDGVFGIFGGSKEDGP